MNSRLRGGYAATAAALVLAATLAGCGSESGLVATDPAGRPSSAPPSASPTPTPEPSASPTVGSYPAYPHQDYDFTVAVMCFCANAGEPARVEVRDGEATSATWVKKGRGHRAGDPAEFSLVTINDIIDRINNPEAARVDVTWPAGQDYPSQAYIDLSKRMADEEVGYTLSDVVPLD